MVYRHRHYPHCRIAWLARAAAGTRVYGHRRGGGYACDEQHALAVGARERALTIAVVGILRHAHRQHHRTRAVPPHHRLGGLATRVLHVRQLGHCLVHLLAAESGGLPCERQYD